MTKMSKMSKSSKTGMANDLQAFKALKLKARSATLLMLPEQGVTANLALERRIGTGSPAAAARDNVNTPAACEPVAQILSPISDPDPISDQR